MGASKEIAMTAEILCQVTVHVQIHAPMSGQLIFGIPTWL